tara:strand:+ start:1858 stop:2997 length:1140 start_codon:yes stop_codon:yes gene_type:complete
MSQTKVEAPFVEGGGGSNFKNLIINGDMSIFQRATATTTVSNGTYQTADRFKLHESTDGAYTAELENLSVADQATTGQRTALELNVTTADGTIGSSQFAAIYHSIEAQFLQHILYGTSAAKDLTLSFWVKSNKTGTYCVAMDKNDNTAYRLPIEYTISSANTWEKKVIHISPTAGSTSLITASGAAIDNNNGTGMIVTFGLAWGSSYQGTNNTWVTGNAYATSNQVNWMDSTSNNFYITGIQLEVGDDASDFEHLPHDVQLQRCQRYFQLFNDGSTDNEGLFNGTLYTTSALYGYIHMSTRMRATPSLYEVNGTNYFVAYTNNSNDLFDDLAINSGASGDFILEVYTGSGDNLSLGSGGQSAFVRTHNTAARLGADAEL